MRHSLLIFAVISGLLFTDSVKAQDFDDIYFDSSKSAKKEKKQPIVVEEVADDYVDASFTGRNYVEERDVDEYNRRGSHYSASDSISNGNDSTYTDEDSFQYTERIKRFHNPTVIIESTDPDVAELYVYTRPSVNLVVGTTSYTPWSVSSFYYTPSWSYYDPWRPYGYVGWGYDPFYFSLYDPFYYGCGYYSWHYPYHHHHYGYWHPYHSYWGYGYIPHYGHGGNLAHNPTRYRSNGNGRRPTGVGTSNFYRGSSRTNSGGSRIGNIVSTKPSSSGTVRPSQTTGRGGTLRSNTNSSSRNSSSSNGGVYRRPSSSSSSNSNIQRSTTNSSRSTYNNYNSNNSYSGSRSSGSFGGSRSSGSSSGGSRGGGGHRR